MQIAKAGKQERAYFAPLSERLAQKCGQICCGIVRLDLTECDRTIEVVPVIKTLYNSAFQQDFKIVAECLRNDAKLLRNAVTMKAFCENNGEISIVEDDVKSYKFRTDTLRYTYLTECFLTSAGGVCRIYCFERKSLDRHLSDAREGISFRGGDGKEKFRLSNGDRLVISNSNGTTITEICRYIDSAYFQCGDAVYHIGKFAQLSDTTNIKTTPFSVKETIEFI